MYDFIHIETYPLQVSAKKGAQTAKESGARDSQQTVKGIVGEAIREPENCPHVEAPKPPTFLVGNIKDFKKLPELLENRFKTMKTEQGRAYRKDTHVLLSGVASYPRDGTEYEDWKARTLAFLRAEYGDNLRHVIEHTDEEHPHMHFYAFSDTEMNARKLHDGCIAEMKAEKEKGERLKASERRKAFADGCREYLDRFHASVGVYFGMDRVGPSRRRLSRSEYNAEKAEKMKLAEGLRELEQRAQGLEAEAKRLASELVSQHIKANYKKTKLKAPDLGFFDRLTMSVADIVEAMEPQLRAIDKVKAGLKLVTDENDRLTETTKKSAKENQELRIKLSETQAKHEMEIRRIRAESAQKLKQAESVGTLFAMVEMIHPEIVQEVKQALEERQQTPKQPQPTTPTSGHDDFNF